MLGIYSDSSEIMPLSELHGQSGHSEQSEQSEHSGPNSAAWVWNSDLEIWSHPESYQYEYLEKRLGYQLITKSGIFMMDDERFVRDFTEVGADRIHETYSFVKDLSIHW